jgi:hypothetical protein
LGNNSWENYFLDGETIPRHKCILKFFNQLLSTNCKRRWFLTIKRPKFSKNCLCYTSFFLKGSLVEKIIRYGVLKNIWYLFRLLFSLFPQRTIYSPLLKKSSKHWNVLNWHVSSM